MRHSINSGRPGLARSRATAGVAALLTVIAVATAVCSSGTGPGPAPSDSAPSAAAPLVAHAAPMGKSTPDRVLIPAIDVDSTLMDLGLQANGRLQVPPAGFPVGWYTGAPSPGELGPAILAGHVEWSGQPGVFYRLHELKAGDEVTVTRHDGTAAVFRMTRVDQFPKDEFPSDTVYGDIGNAGLRLITCGGSLNTQTHSYDSNIVAFADLVEARNT